MQRFICNQEEILNHITINDKDEIHHIKDVSRLKRNDALELIDGEGMLYKGNIAEIKKDKIVVKVENRERCREDKPKITLACAIPKKAKMECIIEKTTELGVDTIIPLKTKRTIVNFKKPKEEQVIARWQRIALEASKQSKRIFVSKIEKTKTLKETLSCNDFDIKLIPTLEGEREDIKDSLKNRALNSVFILIGPEGDFTRPEIELAKQNGCLPVSMGNSTLKVDTAAIVAVGLVAIMLKK